MKILIDLQALQTGSAQRGIGRYSSALTLALIDELKRDDLYILINECEDSNEDSSLLKSILSKIQEANTLRFPLAAVASPGLHLKNEEVVLSKILRERFIEALAPDVVLITSLFEFDALSTIPIAINRSYFCAAILYDLIPLSDTEHYLPNDVLRAWYEDRLQQLRCADALLAISEYVRLDALKRLNLPASSIKNISAGASLGNENEGCENISKNLASQILNLKPYILYVGGFDKRKNLECLIATFAKLPKNIRKKYRLVLAGGLTNSRRSEVESFVAQQKLSSEDVFLWGFIEDQQLVSLYKNAHLFVFPSLDEGFGLPPLEAMTFGIPTITSNRASLPEVVGNERALFDPDIEGDFLNKLEQGLVNDVYRADLISRGSNQSLKFSWKISAEKSIRFIRERVLVTSLGHPKYYLSFRDFVLKTYQEYGLKLKNENGWRLKKLLTRALLSSAKTNSNGRPTLVAAELKVSDSFAIAIPDYSKIVAPYVFSSMLCREQHFHLPLYTYWCTALGENPRFHRKQWEFVYICQVLHERGYLREGSFGIGFGVGKEPLVSYFASRGAKVLATDLDFNKAAELGWVTTNQHSDSLNMLNERGLCEADKFNNLASFRNVDMNNIPENIGYFDFCWSSCAFEHLGSIRKGLDFVIQSARLLKPGGVAVHTTEYNVSSNAQTLDNNVSFVIFRRRDIELLVDELKSEGFEVEPIDFAAGEDELERYIDLPPYVDEPHLRLQLAGKYVSTSLGIIIRAPGIICK